MPDTRALQQLHDAYVWEVNAAVGEDRLDLVWQLVDDFTDEALRLLTDSDDAGCGRPDCVVCTHVTHQRATRRRRWQPWHRRH